MFNKKQDIKKPKVQAEDEKVDEVTEIFNLDEVRAINNGWVECAYDLDLLK